MTTIDGLWPTARWDDAVGEDAETLSVIVQRVADGESLKAICKSRLWPYSLVAKWLAEDVGRKSQYDAALALWGDSLAQEAVAIADTVQVGVIRKTDSDGGVTETQEDMLGHRKLQVDTRLKLAAKLDRERYGDRVVNAPPSNPQDLIDAALEGMARKLLDRMRVVNPPDA